MASSTRVPFAVLVLVALNCCFLLTSTIPIHTNSAVDWDKDCFILCHYECSMWKGTDITYCAHQCMARGFDKYRMLFQPKWCFNLAANQKRSHAAGRIGDGRDYYQMRL